MTKRFPPFSLSRLLRTVFAPSPGERVAVLIDLPDPKGVVGFEFLKHREFEIQSMAYEHVYRGLQDGILKELQLEGGELFCYRATAASNLDLPDEAYSPDGAVWSFEEHIYPAYDILLCISTNSATAPLTASAKQHGFRGATLHGLNPVILSSGLSVNYEDVSREAEELRSGMSRAQAVELDFQVEGRECALRLELGGQEAQKSHGLCREGPDVANLPAGEVYYVPCGGSGHFPLRLEDGTLALLTVRDGCAVDASLIRGDERLVRDYAAKLKDDPATGALGELGFGTQDLPVSGRDIQDEKIFGTFHIATGRNDHLGGDVTPDKFRHAHNASHDDILYGPEKTPEIRVPQVRMYRDGQVHVLFEDYRPARFLLELRNAQPV
ncbi:MAG: hypothetical protein HY319_03240 [Armatimonadetes bacterium]|nr:hypothetical protein [Armatimonadota bacterium]